MVSEKGACGQSMVMSAWRGTRKVTPPSAPTDSFRQIVDAFKAGRDGDDHAPCGLLPTRSSEPLGDKVSAVPVSRAADGQGWTYFGDESNAVFAASKAKEATFRWISFLSTAENNNEIETQLTGQLPITTSGAPRSGRGIPSVFVDASSASRHCLVAAGSSQDTGLHRPRMAHQHAESEWGETSSPTT